MNSSKEALQERREKVWELRVVDRRSYRDIAKALGINVSTVHADAKWLSEHRIKALEGKDKQLIVTQNEIYEAMLNELLPIALGSGQLQDKLYAADRVARILSDQAKLFGFHQLPKASGEAKELGKGLAEGVIEAMSRIAIKSQRNVVEAELIDQPKIEDASKET